MEDKSVGQDEWKGDMRCCRCTHSVGRYMFLRD